jgi:hypothetical protein
VLRVEVAARTRVKSHPGKQHVSVGRSHAVCVYVCVACRCGLQILMDLSIAAKPVASGDEGCSDTAAGPQVQPCVPGAVSLYPCISVCLCVTVATAVLPATSACSTTAASAER